MDRRQYLEGLGAVVATGSLAGCAGSGSGTDEESPDRETNEEPPDGKTNEEPPDGSPDERTGDDGDETNQYGFLSTSVTDQPNDIGDFESLVVTLGGLWVKPGDTGETASDDETASDGEETVSDDETASDDEETGGKAGGRSYIEFDEPQEADLVQLQGEKTELIDETELETGEYQFLQLDVRETKGVLESNGEDAVVETPGDAPLKFNQAFEIRAEERTRFIADFAPFRRGNEEYLVRPVASGTQVIYDGADVETGTDTAETETDTAETETADNGGTTESGTGATEAGN